MRAVANAHPSAGGFAVGHSERGHTSSSDRFISPKRAYRRQGIKSLQNGFVEPVAAEVAAFAPATIANLGPGFDWLGCAVQGAGDTVVARAFNSKPGTVVIESIEGEAGQLSLDVDKNCAGVAAMEALKLIGKTACGVSLSLKKGLPLGSGMGSSAASAAAGAWAVNLLFGSPLKKSQLVLAALAAEAVVSGYHADNVGPALLGGFVLIRSYDPLDVHKLNFPEDLWFVLVTPKFKVPTMEMRAVLPEKVPMSNVVTNCSMGAALVAAILVGDAKLLGASLNSDAIVEPVRGPLIPGFYAAKQAAVEAGAYGCTIGGAGPTTVAVVSDPETGKKVAAAMEDAFKKEGSIGIYQTQVVQLDREGAASVTIH